MAPPFGEAISLFYFSTSAQMSSASPGPSLRLECRCPAGMKLAPPGPRRRTPSSSVSQLTLPERMNAYSSAAGALAAAVYLAGGVRGMERGTLSEQREPDGTEPIADVELLRLALPRRVFTMSQVLYAVDRITWLHENRELVGGLRWVEEPSSLRFFFGRLEPTSDWQEKLVKKFRDDFGDSL